MENVEQARARFPQISFEKEDVENPEIRKLGEFDLVLCFGLLYHLENPLLGSATFHSLTGKVLLIGKYVFSRSGIWMLLREEPFLRGSRPQGHCLLRFRRLSGQMLYARDLLLFTGLLSFPTTMSSARQRNTYAVAQFSLLHNRK